MSNISHHSCEDRYFFYQWKKINKQVWISTGWMVGWTDDSLKDCWIIAKNDPLKFENENLSKENIFH